MAPGLLLREGRSRKGPTMNRAIRSNVWILELGLVAAVALTAARLVNLTLEVLILPVPSRSTAARGALPLPRSRTSILDAATL